MPLFEYECCACRKAYECVIIGDWSPRCPHCGSSRGKKIMSAPAIINVADYNTNLRKNTGCKGFEVSYDNGKTKIPMYNQYKRD